MFKMFWIKHRSSVYAGFTLTLPYLVFAPAHMSAMLTIVTTVLVLALSLQIVPRYTKGILDIEDAINLKLGFLTPARAFRLLSHMPLFFLIQAIANSAHLTEMQILATIAAACGLHTLAIAAAYKGIGDRAGNSLLAFCVGAMLTTLIFVDPAALYIAYTLAFFWLVSLLASIRSDLRSVFYPKHGVGVFFGSFNPVHKTHVRILQQAIQQRGLRKVYIHPTTVPKLHRVALEKGEISMKEEAGMRVYSTTALADPHKHYFPTGRKFYEYELRQQLLQAAIFDAGLQDKVEVLDLPAVYDQGGFFAVLENIKRKLAPGEPLHGMHGSDVGGIWVRNIFELSGDIYPFPVVRSDCISATAIREGAVGYTTPTIEAFLEATRAGKDFVFPTGYLFKNSNIDGRLE